MSRWLAMARRLAVLAILTLAPAPAVLCGAPAGALAAAGDPAGRVAALVGMVVATGQGEAEARALAPEAPVFEGDRIETASGSRVRLVFADDSVVMLGENTTLTVDWFLYAPRTSLRSALLLVPAGIFRVIVGALIPDSQFEVRTATAVASVRGTDWMAEATADATAVVVLEGRVAVGNALGEVTLGRREGTTVRAGEPPTPPSEWGQARIDAFERATAVP